MYFMTTVDTGLLALGPAECRPKTDTPQPPEDWSTFWGVDTLNTSRW